MRQTEQTAKTVEEAVEQGLHLLGVTRDQVEVEVLEEPGGGVFGLGSRQARVRVMVREADVDKAREVLEQIVKLFGLDAVVETDQTDELIRFDLLGENLGILIGHRGQTLNALQFLLTVILSRGMENLRVRCVLDVEGYRMRRERSLQILAERMARKASMERRPIALEPMLSQERRIIHLALEKNPYVTTSSEGTEPGRRVVIQPKERGRKPAGPRRYASPASGQERPPSSSPGGPRGSNRNYTFTRETRRSDFPRKGP